MAGLNGAVRRPSNLTKVREVRQGPEESPAAFLERLMEAFHQHTPYDPSKDEYRPNVVMSFVEQSSVDIKKKLQRMDGLQDKSLRELVQVAETVYLRETEEEKKERERKEQEWRELQKERH